MRNFVFFLMCLPACATTYYVANAGNDSNSGTNAYAPWKTVAKVNASYFSPGDSILFNRGDVWHEQLTPPSSGYYGNQVTYSAYGVGANPVITGADLITNWQGGSSSGGGGGSTTQGCTGSCVFSSGMETAGFTDWSSVYAPAGDGTTVTQSSAVAHSGTYSMQLKGGGSDNRGGLSESFTPFGAEGTLYFRFYMYVPAGSLKPNSHLLLFQIPQGSTNISLYTDGNGNIVTLQYYANGGSIVPYASLNFAMGAWNYFDVAFKAGAGDGGGQVWLNGTSLGSNYSLNTSGSTGVNSVLLGNDSFGSGLAAGGSVYFDDFEVATSGPIGAATAGATSTNTAPANGVWSASLPTQPYVVFIAGNPGVQESTAAQVTAAGEWAWTNGTLYVYSATGAPPSNVEAAQRNFALLMGQTGPGSYVTVSGIDFRISNGDVVHIVNTAGDIINGGLITGAYQFGLLAIGISGGSLTNLQVTNNTVSMNGSTGIEISAGHTGVTVQGNTVFGNASNPTFTGDFIEMGGILLLGNASTPNYDLVQNNVSDNNGVYNGNESEGSGIWFDSITYSTMQNNVSFNNAAFGLYFEKTVSSNMLNNVSYSNAYVPDTANIAAYASQGIPSYGNTINGNYAWGSQTWGMKLGAYQGAGATKVYNNKYTNNVVFGSQSIDLYGDTGADNDGQNGFGNVYSGNGFGTPTQNWLYWVTYGFISNYSQLDAAYGSPANSNQSNWSLTPGDQERCTGSCIFASGMETGNFSDWSGVYRPASDGTTVSQSNNLVHSGAHALQISGAGVDNRGGLIQSFGQIGSEGLRYFRFYMYVPAGALKANDSFTVFELPAGGGANMSLGTDANGNITTLQFSGSGSTIIPSTLIPFTMGQWNYFDVAFRAGSGDGGAEVWLNGNGVGGSFSVNTSGSAGVSSVLVGNDSYGHGQVAGGNMFFDDFQISGSGPIGAAAVTLPIPY